ncbi:MAG: PKD domain-containing protein [Crocinitomicaceae bacterium]
MLFKVEKVKVSSDYFSEYNFVPVKNGAFFLSDRSDLNLVQIKDHENGNINRIYFCSERGGKYGKPKVVDIKFSNHMGSFSVNQDGNYIVFTGRQSKNSTTVGLFQTEKIGGNWSRPTLVIKNQNETNFTDPFFNAPGDTLFFASDMAGGFGGLDIYRATGEKGAWSNFTNLGKSVNSSFNDRFPVYVNQQLYYTSNRPEGKGGLGIYSLSLENDVIALPIHSPINSEFDDFNCAIGPNQEIFFTSNREGTDDIYKIATHFPDFECFSYVEKVRCYEFYEENSEQKDTTLFRYEWNMGDGALYSTVSTDHCFKDTGLYLVTLEIREIQSDTLVAKPTQMEVWIEDPIQLEMNRLDSILVGRVFSVTVLNEMEDENTSFYWNFGDGTFAFGKTVDHTYKQVGSFEVSVGRIEKNSGEERKICTSMQIIVKE